MGPTCVATPAESAVISGLRAEGRDFRAILRAMSRPGTVTPLPDVETVDTSLPPAIASVARCLFDLETPVWLDAAFDTEDVRRYLKLHSGAPLVIDPGRATFAVIGAPDKLPSLDVFRSGELEYPDRSTTLVIRVPSLTGGPPIELAGPGIASRVTFNPDGLPPWFWAAWDANAGRFPLGVDILFTDAHRLVGLPRTTKRI